MRMSRTRELRYRIEDAYPPLGLPAAKILLGAVRRAYREQLARQRRLGAKVSPGNVVRSGPFAGMRYHDPATNSVLLPKLAGTYELEVAHAIERMIRTQPDLVLDVGSAEGYYAVGMAWRLPRAKVVAFDLRSSQRYLTSRLAEMNGVDLEIRGAASVGEVEALLQSSVNPVVICDIDGGEDVIIDPSAVPSLSRAALLVETHDMFVDSVTDRITHRLSSTHDVTFIASESRDAGLLDGLPPEEAAVVVDEHRSEQGWLVAVPRRDPHLNCW
jgi:hypothetical protein